MVTSTVRGRKRVVMVSRLQSPLSKFTQCKQRTCPICWGSSDTHGMAYTLCIKSAQTLSCSVDAAESFHSSGHDHALSSAETEDRQTLPQIVTRFTRSTGLSSESQRWNGERAISSAGSCLVPQRLIQPHGHRPGARGQPVPQAHPGEGPTSRAWTSLLAFLCS